MSASLHPNGSGSKEALIQRFDHERLTTNRDMLAVEEPLEIRLAYGPAHARELKSISITMRTPGNDEELAAGFLLTEGVIRDATDVAKISTKSSEPENGSSGSQGNIVTVNLDPAIEVTLSTLQRNFYVTSSCGVCGKASLMGLRTVCPPRHANEFVIDPDCLCSLQARLREVQGLLIKPAAFMPPRFSAPTEHCTPCAKT